MCPWNLEGTEEIYKEEVNRNETDISAEEPAENEGARLQKENGHQEWQKRSQEKKSEGQKEPDRLVCFDVKAECIEKKNRLRRPL